MTNLKYKVALITGGTKGIGRAIAEKFAGLGIKLVLNYASDQQSANDTLAMVNLYGVDCLLVKADLSKPAEIERMFNQAIDKFGTLDIVVANAGFELTDRPFLDHTEADFDKVFDLNAKGTFFTMQQAARRLSDGGRIIAISSTISENPVENAAAYSASKAAIKLFVKVLSKEIGHRGITVNTIMPGTVESAGVFANVTEDVRRQFAEASPLGRMGRPADTANVAAYLISDEAGFIHGHHLAVNGGSAY